MKQWYELRESKKIVAEINNKKLNKENMELKLSLAIFKRI